MAFLVTLWRVFCEAVFPRHCVLCGAEEIFLCSACQAGLNHKAVLACPVCGVESASGALCPRCYPGELDGVIALGAYRSDEPFGKLIKQFKYQGAKELTAIWSGLFESFSLPLPTFSAAPVVFPVPLHPRRQRWRGFNQAALLAEIVAHSFGFTGGLSGSLVRIRHTNQQARLTPPERLRNVAGAFAWRKREPAPRVVILVDDVYTTGATLRECARVLKKNGSEMVWGLVLARD